MLYNKLLIELAEPVYSLGILLIIIPFKLDIIIHPENKYPPIKIAIMILYEKINNKFVKIKEIIQQ